jgi:hypothetical protein
MIRKIASLSLILIMSFGLFGCGSNGGDGVTTPTLLINGGELITNYTGTFSQTSNGVTSSFILTQSDRSVSG